MALTPQKIKGASPQTEYRPQDKGPRAAPLQGPGLEPQQNPGGK